jgi:DNA-binding response OmpR family regulator
MGKILVVEDEADLAELLGEGLSQAGHEVAVVHDGAKALEAVAAKDFDLMVLDRGLPVMGGDTVAKLLRDYRNPVRILMLTALATPQDTIDGLELGADEYMTKPFEYPVFLARVNAMLRRIETPDGLKEYAGFRVDPDRSLAWFDGRLLKLRPKELEVLEELVGADGGFRSTEYLLDTVWEGEDVVSGVVKAVIHTLRAKTSPDAIISEPGLGYRLAEASAQGA